MTINSGYAVDELRRLFGVAVQEQTLLAPYTSARIGGPADVLLIVKSAQELAAATQFIWEKNLPYVLLGGGANLLISDKGVRGIVVINKAREVRFETGVHPRVWCEAGAVFSNLANRCASQGLSGLEWAATIPGTVGGAVYGNAGAFGGDMSAVLLQADLLTDQGRCVYSAEEMGYGYRTSVLKKGDLKAVVLSALLSLETSTKEEVSAKIETFSKRRKNSQPTGASMGSMFKNPMGDYAGRLIEAAGLKGTRIGQAEISSVHANFFVNHGDARAADVRALIDLTRATVKQKLDVELELEIELAGEW